MEYYHDQVFKCGKCGAESDFVGMFMRTMGTDETEALTELNREECWEASYADGKKHYGNGLADLEREWREKEPVSDPSPVATPTPETVKKSILPKGSVAAGRDNARKPRTLEDFVSVFQKVTKIGEGKYKVLCPCHDDTKPSLSISLGNNGKILMHCFNDCDNQAILSAVGYTVDDFYLDKDYGQTGTTGNGEKWQRYVEGREHKKVEGIYHYHTTTGDYSFTRLRMEGKNFIYGILDNGRFTYGFGGRSRRDIPAVYCPDLADFRKAITDGQTVYYCEGEKDVNTLTRYGLHAITCGGTSDWNKECVSLFEDANVVILADNDVTGKKLGDRVRADVARVANTVKVVIPTPDIPKGDVSDYLATHTVKELLTLVNGEEEKQAPSDPAQEAPKEPTPPTPPEAPKEPEVKQEPTPKAEESPIKPINLDVFHNMEKGIPKSVNDYAILEYLLNSGNIFFMGKRPYVYDNGVFINSEKRVKSLIQSLIYKEFIKAPTIKRIYDLLEMETKLDLKQSEVNVFPETWINFKNGFYDPVNKVIVPHDKKYRAINQIPHVFNPEKEVNNTVLMDWLLSSCIAPDDVEMLLQYSGYCMTTNMKQQKFMMLTGRGGDGKSVVIDIITRMVGEENTSTVNLKRLEKNSFSIYSMTGKLLNTCGDEKISSMEDVSVIKQITGEDRITAEQKNKDEFSFRPYCKLLYSVNKLPIIALDQGDSFYRRLLVLEMKGVEESKRDPDFEEKMLAHLDEFIILSVRALERMYENKKITVSENSQKRVIKLHCDSDSIEGFLYNCTEKKEGAFTEKTSLKMAYESYCARNDIPAKKKSELYDSMADRGYTLSKISNWGYKGILLKKTPLIFPQKFPNRDSHNENYEYDEENMFQ